jgi:hypothetical protein
VAAKSWAREDRAGASHVLRVAFGPGSAWTSPALAAPLVIRGAPAPQRAHCPSRAVLFAHVLTILCVSVLVPVLVLPVLIVSVPVIRP